MNGRQAAHNFYTGTRHNIYHLLVNPRFIGPVTSHQHQRCSCQHSPRGRLRYADRLRRPRWRIGQP
jgi:hypothetical protein